MNIVNANLLGHNNPPSEMEILQDRLDSYTDEYAKLQRLSGKEIPEEITEDTQASEVTDHIISLKDFRKDIEKIFKKEKEPFLECTRIADNWKNDYWKKIDALIDKAERPALAWNKKKEAEERERQLEIARKAQEEADKLLAEAAAHDEAGIKDTAEELVGMAVEEEQKAAMITSNAVHGVVGRTGGSFGTSKVKTEWVGTLESRAALDLEALRNYFTEDALDKAIKAAVKDGVKKIRGAIIKEEDKLSTRRR